LTFFRERESRLDCSGGLVSHGLNRTESETLSPFPVGFKVGW